MIFSKVFYNEIMRFYYEIKFFQSRNTIENGPL